MIRVLLLIGTRPETIKMAPIVQECRLRSDRISPFILSTGQHRQLLDPIASYFSLHPDADLGLMERSSNLAELTANALVGVDRVLAAQPFDCAVAQGDTTSVLAASMASFYRRVPFVHVEAGLRTPSLDAPWPEEFNRRAVSLTATLHAAPTERAMRQLLGEGKSANDVRWTGNTVIDALLSTLEREKARGPYWSAQFPDLEDQPLILVTAHRRESFGIGIVGICEAIACLAQRFPDVRFVWPVHANPSVREPVHARLSSVANIRLIEPVSYPAFVWLMHRSVLLLSDSGGVQEEAPTIGKPVLVLRETTERPEAVECGAAELVGTDPDRIVERVTLLLTDESAYRERQVRESPFGDGHAAARIVDWIEERFASRPQ